MQGGLYEKCTEMLFEQMHGVIKCCWDTWTHLNGIQGAINGIIILALSASHLAGRLWGGGVT